MSLDNVGVLVDAYNLQLGQGTGIKSYTLSLLNALDRLGSRVGLLYSRPGIVDRDHPILTEVAFFDVAQGLGRKDALRLLPSLLRACSGLRLPAVEVPLRFVVRPEVPANATILTRAQCFRLAYLVNAMTGRPLRMSTPSRFDIWHATYPIPIRVKGARTVITVHDLVPFRLPYTTLDRKREQFRHHLTAIREADAIVAVSEATKADILSVFDVDPAKVWVTYQPANLEALAPQEEGRLDAELARFDLRRKSYILFVGAIEPKKNVRTLIEACLEIDTDIPLVIVGKKAWLWKEQLKPLETLRGRRASRRVRLLDHVEEEDLRRLYAGALCFAFPSLYEGFGLPPLEAMSFGVPVITSNVASLPEVCGEAALYVDPYSTDELRAAIERMIGDEGLRRRLAEAGRHRATFFSMDNYVARLAQAYEHVL